MCNWVYGYALIRTHTHIYVMYILYMGSVSRHQPIGFRSQLMWQTAPWNPIIFYGLSQASKGQQSLSLSLHIYIHTNLCKYNRYIRMYIHTYNIPIHVRLIIHIYFTCSHTHTHTHAHKHTPTHTYIYIYILHTHTYIYYIYIYILYTRTHTHIYIYICIYTYTYACIMRVDGWI